MTVLLYQSDSYCQKFSACVTGISTQPSGIVLDVTAFYPGGGGQPCDIGVLSSNQREFAINKTIKLGANIIHCVAQGTVLPEVGELIEGKLNWERRYQLMRTHTAMHILCGVVFRDYGALVTGGDMEPLRGRMDFEFERMDKGLVTKIESAINQEVNKNHEVFVRLLPREEAFRIPDLIRTKINLLPEGIQKVRVVEISGLDLQADGGTHVQFTSEVGPIKVVDYKSKGKINKRIYVEL